MNFDFVAPHYWWLERCVFGRTLERCRRSFLDRLAGTRRALFIGEGDGRFLASFLSRYVQTRAVVVERSGGMIRNARRRTQIAEYHCGNALAHIPGGEYDLVVTHFVLDSLTPAQVESLAAKVRAIAPGGKWLVSEFRALPGSSIRSRASRFLIWLMYRFFRIFAGLRVNRIPDYAAIFRAAGFSLEARRAFWHGMIVAELWRIRGA
jgi:SAM-dependent methyltransferase